MVADEEVGEEAEEALGLFELEFLVRGVGRVRGDVDLNQGGGDLESDG